LRHLAGTLTPICAFLLERKCALCSPTELR